MYLSLFLLPLIAHYARIRVQFRAKLLKFERKIAKIALKVCVNRNIDLNYARSKPLNCISGTFFKHFTDKRGRSDNKKKRRLTVTYATANLLLLITIPHPCERNDCYQVKPNESTAYNPNELCQHFIAYSV